MQIPVVDLSSFTGSDIERKKDFVRRVGKAFEEVGFVAVKNHLIPGTLINTLYERVQQFLPCLCKKNSNMKFPVWPGKEGILLLAVSTPGAARRRI